ILNYIMREMVSPEGAFYSSQDADSEGEEGKFFVWDADEWREILTEEEFRLAYDYYGLSREGNFEGKNILTRNDGEKSARRENISKVREKIRILREKRIHPALDDKILTNWNSLMIYSFALAFGITGKQEYAITAGNAAEFLLRKCRKGNTLFHSYKNGEARIEGFLDDYAFLAEALFMLFEVTSEEKWLNECKQLADQVTERFYDEENHGFYYTEGNSDELIVRVKDLYDNALPSGNSSAIIVLLKLSEILNKKEFLTPALISLESMKEYMVRYPESFAYLCSAALFYLSGPSEIVIAAENKSAAENAKREYFNEFFPFSVIAFKDGREDSSLEILQGKELIKPPLTVYICRNFSCRQPVFSVGDILSEYRQMAVS
ncbi:MAG: thioredoxin domain-containing protein, partial [Syntrophothermus sp.]